MRRTIKQTANLMLHLLPLPVRLLLFLFLLLPLPLRILATKCLPILFEKGLVLILFGLASRCCFLECQTLRKKFFALSLRMLDRRIIIAISNNPIHCATRAQTPLGVILSLIMHSRGATRAPSLEGVILL
jgi:hypothetical protein